MADLTYPEDLRYTVDHEWVRADGGSATVGITDYAQSALGDVVFVDLPEVGAEVTAGEACGEVESTKSVSDLVAPVSGTVTAVNGDLDGSPELVNSDPYGGGWLYKVALAETGSAEEFLDVAAYTAQLD